MILVSRLTRKEYPCKLRNVPNFEEFVEFVVDKLDVEVAEKYRLQGDVTNPAAKEAEDAPPSVSVAASKAPVRSDTE